MRCYYVLVHGKLEWASEPIESDDLQPAGFYCYRYVLASGYEDAAEKACSRVRKNLEKQTDWLGRGAAKLTLEAEELEQAPVHKLLERKAGHAFYEIDDAAPAGAE